MCYKLYNSGYQFKYFPILISYFDRSGISSTDPYKGLKESAELTDTKYTLAFLLFIVLICCEYVWHYVIN